MRGRSALIICLMLIAVSLFGVVNTGGEGSIPARGSFATHDSGNFTINIGDDGGATGWDTLEFPAGEDRLSSASFGIGTGADSVDFGSSFEFETEHDIEISTPGNYTDEEGFARFSGWSGEDFDDVEIVQRTFMNDYRENERGHCGRWFVVDYEIDSDGLDQGDTYLIQTLNIDLGASASDDSFSFMDDINATVISDGSTFIGMAVFTTGNWSRYHGHNAGEYGPSVYNTESSVWGQMSSPNNITSSSTQQDWYMDMVAKIDNDPRIFMPVHVSFIIMVGNSQYDLRNAYHDAVNGLTGEFVIGPQPEWTKGNENLTYQYHGPFPPSYNSHYDRYTMVDDEWIFSGGGNAGTIDRINQSISLSGVITTDWLALRFHPHYDSPFNGREYGDPFIVKVDQKGPDTVLSYTNTDPTGTLKISTSVDDRGGSGVFRTYLSIDNETFVEAYSLQLEGDSEDLNFYGYSVDNVGNAGPRDKLEGLFIDGTPPLISDITIAPEDLNDKTAVPIAFSISAVDSIAGVDQDSVMYRYRFTSDDQPSSWQSMEFDEGSFSALIEEDLSGRGGQDLTIDVKVEDELGNGAQDSMVESIEAVNDPPQYLISIPDVEYATTEVPMVLTGEDLDGDLVTFEFEYRLGDGPWNDIPKELLEQTEKDHFIFTLPNVTFEGDLQITGSAFDGNVTAPLNVATIPIDRKAPVIGVEGLPTSQWSDHVSLTFSAVDGVSGVDELWYLEEIDGTFQLFTSNKALLIETGPHNITVLATDNAGNSRSLELDTILIDSISPEVHHIQFEPQDPKVGEDFEVHFTAYDLHSLPHSILSQAPSLFLEVWIEFQGVNIFADSIIPVTGEEDRFVATFNDPFDIPLTGGMVRINFTDEAGNEIGVGQGPLDVGSRPIPCSLDIDYPDPVGIGQRFEVTLTSEGPVMLEAKYPMTARTWIITPMKTEGDEYTYELPGPNRPEDILFKVYYGPEDAEEMNLTCPVEGWFNISVTGWIDSDGDGLGNDFEILYSLDHQQENDVNEDIDGDGLTLIEEMNNLTDPDNKDTDGDGMDDQWESIWGTLPFREDAYEDIDDDTWSNIKEFDAGTDPRDPDDKPEEIPVTPWYWIVLIIVVLLSILAFFIFQLFQKRKLEDDIEDTEDEMKWDQDG